MQPLFYYLNAVVILVGLTLPSGNASPLKKMVKRQAASTTFSSIGWSDIPTIDDQIHLVLNVGPTGGNIRGYSAIRQRTPPDNDLVFYVNGLLSPDIHLVRNITYYFFPLTGFEYPVYITDDSEGGYAFQDDDTRSKVHVFAGLDNQGLPSMIGLYCAFQSNLTQNSVDQLQAYASYFSTLSLACEPTYNRTMATYFSWTPDKNTPSVVYYQSYNKEHMGGKLLVTDSFYRD